MELDFVAGGVTVDGEFYPLPDEACLVFSLTVKHWDATHKTPAVHLFDWEPCVGIHCLDPAKMRASSKSLS